MGRPPTSSRPLKRKELLGKLALLEDKLRALAGSTALPGWLRHELMKLADIAAIARAPGE